MDTNPSGQQYKAYVQARSHSSTRGGVAHNLRYYPLCTQAKALIEPGAIGKVNLVHGGFSATLADLSNGLELAAGIEARLQELLQLHRSWRF
jgi:hypothetical protein